MSSKTKNKVPLKRHHFISAYNSIPEAMVFADVDRNIVAVNTAFIEMFGYEEEEVLGRKTQFLYDSEADYEITGKNNFNAHSKIDSVTYEVRYQRKDGESFPSETVGSVVKDDDGTTIGYLGIIKDLTLENKRRLESERLSKRLRLLAQITTGEGEDLDEKVNNALKLTTEILGFDIGIVSRIKGQNYIVQHYYPESAELEQGMSFDLNDTYCSITLNADDVVSIDEMRRSPHRTHPCYDMFQLESYLGFPIQVDGKPFGTINFSSPTPRNEPIEQADKDMVRLLGEWIGSEYEVQKYQNKLLESRNRYKLISNNSADLICLHHPDGTYEFVSPSVINILGYTQKELIGKNPYQLFHPEDLKRIEEESHERARSGEAIKNIQYRIRKKDGNYIWFETATEPITDQHGEITKLQTSSREITERKRLENLLIDTNKLTFVGGWELDVESNELFWTEEVYRIHELPPDTPLEVDNALGFYAEEDKERINKALEFALETGKGWDLELTIITANGNRKWVRAIGKTRMDENGKVYQLYGVFQDLTARKTMEDKLRDRNEQLEKLMETTHEINSIIGHDLKTPLTSIVGLSDLALMELENVEDTEELEYFIKNIYNSSLGMGATLDDLLKWSILQTGVMEPSKEDISLVSISEELNDYFVSTCSSKGVELLFELNGVSEIHSDRQMIKTIIRNLISNAIKFSNPGDTITFGIDSKDEHTWQLSVADEGVGMDEETRSKLFSPNDHPSKRGTSNESGTGLGLRVTYRLINLLNGRIEVESELGKGTKISVYLPKE